MKNMTIDELVAADAAQGTAEDWVNQASHGGTLSWRHMHLQVQREKEAGMDDDFKPVHRRKKKRREICFFLSLLL
jgi:hypothetical protein